MKVRELSRHVDVMLPIAGKNCSDSSRPGESVRKPVSPAP